MKKFENILVLSRIITTFASSKNNDMAKNKYSRFTLVGEFESSSFVSYQTALTYYHKEDTATLYGIDEQGEMSVIFAK